MPILEALRERRAGRYLVGYAVGAWVAAQVVGFFVEQGYVSRVLLDVTLYLLILGLPAVLVFIWFHGRRGHQRVGRRETALIAALAVAALAGTAVLVMRGGRVVSVAAVDPSDIVVDLGEQSVAVLPFENELEDPSMGWLDRGVAELLATDLSQVSSLRVVGGQRVIDLLRQLGEEDSRIVPEALRTRVTQLSGARYMLTGRIAGSRDAIVLIASLVDVDTGEIAAGANRQGPDVFALVDQVSSDLIAKGLSPVAPTGMASVAEMTTASLEAFAEYQRGREARYRFQYEEAGEHFLQAVELDSTFALAHLQLAGIRVLRGDFTGSAESLYRARQNLTHANEHDRLFIEGMDAMIRGEREDGERILRDLISRYPDEKEGRIALAGMLRGREGSSPEVARLIEETLELDPLYSVGYNELAYTEANRGNLDSALALVDRYVRLAPDEPNPLDSRGEILGLAGRADEARESFRAVLRVDPGFTLALRHLVTSLLGEDRAGDALTELASYTASDIPEVRAVARGLAAQAHFWLGEFAAGFDALSDGIEDAAIDTGDRTNLVRSLLFAHVQLGRFDDARPYQRRMAELSPFEGSVEMTDILAAGERGDLATVDRVCADFVEQYRANPTLERFVQVAVSMCDVWKAFYRGDHARVLSLAEEAPFSAGDAGMEYPGFPVMRSLLALGEGERAIAHIPVALNAGISGNQGQWDSLTRRILQYYAGRARELTGDSAGAAAAYQRLVDAWGPAAQDVPLVADAGERLAALDGR